VSHVLCFMDMLYGTGCLVDRKDRTVKIHLGLLSSRGLLGCDALWCCDGNMAI